ncbi:MAG: putative toxin-antitoxin system toxin component, PIN family [Planctomycetes bacterium]|nr:putative toxin-antitoxin system toxin component, PIN family [Planctomycetota bacterium]
MRLVVDTNVLMSALFFGGVPGRVLEGVRRRQWQLVATPAILAEYRRIVGDLGTQFPGVDASAVVEVLAASAILVPDRKPPSPICSDPADDMFLLCAADGRAAAVVTGDRALLRVGAFEGVPVLTVRQWLDRSGRT